MLADLRLPTLQTSLYAGPAHVPVCMQMDMAAPQNEGVAEVDGHFMNIAFNCFAW